MCCRRWLTGRWEIKSGEGWSDIQLAVNACEKGFSARRDIDDVGIYSHLMRRYLAAKYKLELVFFVDWNPYVAGRL